MSLRSSVTAFKNRMASSFFQKLPRFFKKCGVHTENDEQNKDAKVLEFMKENYLLSPYIPAGCTDVM